MTFEDTTIPGCTIVRQKLIADDRGSFVKTFHADLFKEAGLRVDWREDFLSCSKRDVIRGMHFQIPPADHAKLVACLSGRVLDVVVDLRHGSPAHGLVVSLELSPEDATALYVPSGCAHGFLSLTDDSAITYKVTSVHSAENDRGVAWDSIPFEWPVAEPCLSERDRRHPRLEDFVSPFVFAPEAPTR